MARVTVREREAFGLLADKTHSRPNCSAQPIGTSPRLAAPSSILMTMLAVIYTILLGLLCACFVECGIYAFFPAPKAPDHRHNGQAGDSPVETLRSEREWAEHRESAERHSIRHYVMSLLGSSILAGIALRWHTSLGVLADGILLGAVFTLSTGTIFGISGGGRTAKFAVATVSLIVALGLGWTEFLPHTL